MTWFEDLTGSDEKSPEHVRDVLSVDGTRLSSSANGGTWVCGELEIPTLAELRKRVRSNSSVLESPLAKIREVVGDVRQIHCDPQNEGAMFQVASQFNLLEMTSPNVVPEDGVGIYERDFTQGPACAISAGAGTIYRNYFVGVKGQIGQTSENQIDCLSQIEKRLGNTNSCLWEMENGYALPTEDGLKCVNRQLNGFAESELDEVRGLLRIGLQLGTQVTLLGSQHLVSQAFCSAMPVAYSEHSTKLWVPFAKLILEAAYEATICAAIENAGRTNCNRLFLTLLGGGAFGNEIEWITDAIRRAICRHPNSGLDIGIVSYGKSKPLILEFVQMLNRQLKHGAS